MQSKHAKESSQFDKGKKGKKTKDFVKDLSKGFPSVQMIRHYNTEN